MKANIEAFYYRVRDRMNEGYKTTGRHSIVRGMFLPEKYKTRNIDQSKLRGYPKIKGIYFCIDQKKNRIIYIGQSISVYARLASNPHFNHRTMLIRIMHCDDKKRMWYERRWILRFIPKYNTIPNKDMNYKFNPYRRN